MPIYSGARGLAYGFAEETTYGTAVSRTHWFRAVSGNIRTRYTKAKIPVIGGHTPNARAAQRHFDVSIEHGGTIDLIGTYEGVGLLLKHALWGTPTTTGGASPYTHTYLVGPTKPTGGLTVEEVKGNGTAEVFAGARISRLVLRCEAGGLVRVTLDLIAQSSGGRVSAGTPSYAASAATEIRHFQGQAVTWNAASYLWRSAELTIDNRLSRRYLVGDTLSSLYTADPGSSDDQEITFRLVTDWTSDALINGHTADTESDLVLAFSASASRSMTITVQNAYVAENDSPVTSTDVIAETTLFRAQDDGTDYGVRFVVVNTQATATAA
jgi:hypothetical protein